MTKGNPMGFRKNPKAWKGLQGTGKKMLPKSKSKPLTLEEIKRELKQKKQRQHGPRVRGKKAVT